MPDASRLLNSQPGRIGHSTRTAPGVSDHQGISASFVTVAHEPTRLRHPIKLSPVSDSMSVRLVHQSNTHAALLASATPAPTSNRQQSGPQLVQPAIAACTPANFAGRTPTRCQPPQHALHQWTLAALTTRPAGQYRMCPNEARQPDGLPSLPARYSRTPSPAAGSVDNFIDWFGQRLTDSNDSSPDHRLRPTGHPLAYSIVTRQSNGQDVDQP